MREQDDRTPFATFDWTASTSVSTAVVAAVAEKSGDDPFGMTPLYDAVDADSLDRIFESVTDSPTSPCGRVEFEYEGYLVVEGVIERLPHQRAG